MGRRAWGLLLSTFAVFAALVCGPVLIAAGEDAVDGAVIASTNESSALSVEGEGSTKATEDSAKTSNAVSSSEDVAYSWRYEAGELETQSGDSDVMLLSRPTLPEGAAEWGVDVSFAQGDIDWAKAKADGADFAILRLGYGVGGSDRRFVANVQGCKANGIKFGVYLYSYA